MFSLTAAVVLVGAFGNSDSAKPLSIQVSVQKGNLEEAIDQREIVLRIVNTGNATIILDARLISAHLMTTIIGKDRKEVAKVPPADLPPFDKAKHSLGIPVGGELVVKFKLSQITMQRLEQDEYSVECEYRSDWDKYPLDAGIWRGVARGNPLKMKNR